MYRFSNNYLEVKIGARNINSNIVEIAKFCIFANITKVYGTGKGETLFSRKYAKIIKKVFGRQGFVKSDAIYRKSVYNIYFGEK